MSWLCNKGKDFTVAKNTIALITREALNKGVLFVLLVLIGRFLGKEALGRYSLAIAISQIFFFGTELGLNTLLIREVAKEKLLAGKALFNIGILRIVLGLLTMLLIWLTAVIIGAKDETATVIYLCGISYFIISITTVFTSIFRAFEKMELELFIAVIKNVIFLPLAIWALFCNGSLIAIFNIFLATNILALIISGVIFIRQIEIPKFKLDFRFLKAQGKETWPIWIGQLFGIAYLKVAPLLLFRLKGEGAVGLYNAGFVVVDGLWVLATCFVSSIFPVISRLNAVSQHDSKVEYLKGLRFIFLVFLPLGAILILAAPYLVRILYGGKFDEIVPLFRLLTVVAILIALDTHNGLSILAIGKQFVFPFINGAGLIINFILSMFFILRFSYIGSAYALIISEFFVFILMMAVLKRSFSKPRMVK